jgi:hypothetical protein
MGVNVNVGVGSGVEVGSPAGTVSVGTTVGGTVDVNTMAVGGTGVGSGVCRPLKNVTTRVVSRPPMTVMIAANTVGSMDFLFDTLLDITAPISRNFVYSTPNPAHSQVWIHYAIMPEIRRSILPIG